MLDVHHGEIHHIPSQPKWQWVEHFAWLKTSGLMVSGQQRDAALQQIWFVPYRGGKARRISNDLNLYAGVSLDSSGTEIVSVQVQTLSNIYVSRPMVWSETYQITPGSGRYFDLSWMPDGQIVYASNATGSADLWIIGADGTGQHSLTSGLGASYAPASSPDGKNVAFHSNRSGAWNIWMLNLGTGDTTQLTTGLKDSNWPQFTPDSRWVVYHQTAVNGDKYLFKVPASGGTPRQLTTNPTAHPAVSPQDGRIASWYSATNDKQVWKIAVYPAHGGQPVRIFDVASTVEPDSPIRWVPGNQGIAILDRRNGNSNVWLQPLDGLPPRPLTSSASDQMYSFDFSRDGRLAFSKGMTVKDVVLIRDATEQ